MGLNPCGGHGIRSTMTTNRQKIPYPEKGSWKQHEQQPGTDIEDQQARQCRFSRRCYIENLQRRERTTGFFLNARWKCRHDRSLR